MKRLRFFFTMIALKRTLQAALTTFGTMWLITEPSAFFYPELVNAHRVDIFRATTILAAIAGLLYAFPRREYARKLKKRNVILEVKAGDLLDELTADRSNIVVGINNRLTPDNDRGLGESIRSAIARRFFNRRWDHLDRAILDQIPTEAIRDASGVYEVPVGSVAAVEIGSRKVFFVVNQRAPDGNLIGVNTGDYWVCLCRLWESIEKTGNSYPVAVPILGSGMGRAATDRVSLAQLIMISYVMASQGAPLTRRLSIVIREKDFEFAEMHELKCFIDELIV